MSRRAPATNVLSSVSSNQQLPCSPHANLSAHWISTSGKYCLLLEASLQLCAAGRNSCCSDFWYLLGEPHILAQDALRESWKILWSCTAGLPFQAAQLVLYVGSVLLSVGMRNQPPVLSQDYQALPVPTFCLHENSWVGWFLNAFKLLINAQF